MASGLALPVPAMSGAEPCTGSNRPGPAGADRGARAACPIEPVSIAASSLRMSPNRFSVRITSKSGGRATRAASRRCRPAGARAACRGSPRRTSLDGLAPQAAGLEHVGLVDARDLACARSGRRPRRSARSPRPSRCRCRRRVSPSRPRLAEVDAAGELADDEQVGALDALALERARVEQRAGSGGPGAGWRTGRGPCAGRAGPARGAGRRGRWCPTWARRPRRAGRRRTPLQASSVSSVSAVPCASIEAPPIRWSVDLEAAERVEHLARRCP